ncbi:DUF4236 domain-containing protein [Rhodohalobacter barkolensis]|uniref:DUF4236 domain-containing protein n=1 Tax=Rhodohalobacter barkolensis TaxID=2053187 RepID=A0A2N0VLV2_9BACT|nr:DUF4236 domain-containing protein [Rhodohalobacter barkolensis]PKD45185.1 hypothetical protein CWD77_06980 [Rhodohalobacter barkolensis]
MGFFIRKAFKAGPVRINLSKGGVGVSGGITGARLGLNRNGAYVYGGRHGLYYRERIGKKRKSKRSLDQVKPNGRPIELNPHGPTDLFVDTGASFSSPYDLIEPHPWPELIEPLPRHKNPFIWIAIFLLAGISVIIPDPVVWSISAAGFLIILWSVFNDYRWRKKGHQMVESIAKAFEENPKTIDLSPMHRFEEKAPKRYNERFMPDLFSVIIQIAMEKQEDEYIFSYNKLEKQLPVNDEFILNTKQAILTRRMEAVLEDHLLSEKEENEIRDLIKKLDLSEKFIFEELQYLDLASSVRKEVEKPIEEVESSVPLVRGEHCFAVFDDVRLLEERVQERFQHKRVKYRKLGYEIQMEGKLVITDRRLIIYGSGSREYRLNKIQNVIADLEANTIEVTIADRKNPIYLSSKLPMLISARLEKIIESEVK